MAVTDRLTLGLTDARDVLRVDGGTLAPGRISLFSLFRDEMFFAPAFFDHYRGLGIEQFLILDDGSTDGTRDFLAAQPDCVLLASDLSYGQEITFRDQRGQTVRQRAGIYFKMAIPRAFLDGAYVTYVDADEFLLLPPGVAGVAEVVARLAARGDACCVASIVEFFPESVAGLRAGPAPDALADLLAAYGWFQPEPVVEIDAEGFRSRSAGRSPPGCSRPTACASGGAACAGGCAASSGPSSASRRSSRPRSSAATTPPS